VSDDSTDIIYRVSVGDTSFTAIEAWCSTNPEPWDLAWDGTNIWSITGPGGGFDPVHGEREIYKHDAAGNIIEIWHYPPADDPGQGSYGGCGTGLAFAGSQLWYCDLDRNEIIEGIRGAGIGWIAFGSNRDGDLDIWAVRPDGTGLRQITNLPGTEFTPQWSPDSTKIAYATGTDAQIWVYDWFAGTNTKIFDGDDYGGMYYAAEPAWSPDGRRILFQGQTTYNNPHIAAINADGSGRRTIVPIEGGYVSGASWCPSGTAFVYNPRNSGASFSHDLWIYDFTATGNITNGVNHRLTDGAGSESTTKNYPDWTPSGKIVFCWGHNLVLIDPGQSPNWVGPISNPSDPHLTFLTNDASYPSIMYSYPSWSPDLSQIVYADESAATGTYDIWIIDAHPGGSRHPVMTTPYGESYPDWGNPTAEPQPPPVYYVDAVNGNDNNNGLSRRTAFATIAKGIDSAKDGFTLLVYPGVYNEEIDFLGKAIKVQGVATKAGIPVIENPGDFAVSFYNGEGPRSILKNFVVRNSFMAIFIAGSSPTIKNLNIIGNKYGIEAYAGAEPDITNCIFWENSDSDLFGCEARYSFVQQDIEPLPLRGLVAYWSFDENSRNIVPDKSGNEHNGTIYGATWTQGIAGTGLCFDGLNDYVGVPDDGGLSLTDAVTVSAWIWLDPDWLPEGHGGAGAIVCKHNDVSGNGYALRVLKDRRLRALLEGLNFDSQSKVNLARWTHVAFTLDLSNGVVSLYINGNKEGGGVFAGGLTSSGCELRIGDQSCYPGGTGTEVFYGVIDETLIYNRALSPREIHHLYLSQLNSDPRFADAENGDYHLLSQRGRYWPEHDVWVLDKVTSPCIDGGDPNDDPYKEPMPNGRRIDMGAFGGTPYASMSEIKCLDGDINHDGKVNLADLAMLTENWLSENSP
jgi:Tol biopolymer transport system component